MRTTVGKLLRNNIYAFVFGAEGVGKTRLPMSLSKNHGGDCAYVTADSSGPTSLVTAGFNPEIPVEVLPATGEDPFPRAVTAINEFARDPKINVICVDGATVICGRAVDFYSSGAGEKALGWDGWGQILNGFRHIEAACDKATRAGKSVIITAWENPPTYEDTLGGRALQHEGGPLLQGRANIWLPGNCDIVARLTSRFAQQVVNGKAVSAYKGELWVNREGKGAEWRVKTRWALPNPCPADLAWVLTKVQEQSTKQDARAAKHAGKTITNQKEQ